MRTISIIARGVGVAALMVATPALAQSQTDRARTAIVEAEAKIDAAIKVGANTEAPEVIAEAQAALRMAREDLSRSRELASIDDAHQASALADRALGIAERRKAETANATREQRTDAEASTAVAQQDAAAANARADAAASDAAVARSQPPIIITQPAPPTTTVTTSETVATTPARTAAPAPVKRRVVKRRTRTPAASVQRTKPSTTTRTTTTTVKTE